MTRRVSMAHPAPADTSAHAARLTRHLMGRMLELAEDGVRVLGAQDPFAPRSGGVCVDFSTMDNAELARLLERDYGVATRAAQGAVCFSPGPCVTFEDVDYVQGAVLQILSRNQKLPPLKSRIGGATGQDLLGS